MAATLLINSYWADKALYDDAEKKYYENLARLQSVEQNLDIQVCNGTQPTKSSKKSKQKKNKLTAAGSAEASPQVADAPQPNDEVEKKDKKSKNKKANKAVSGGGAAQAPQKTSLASEVAKARQHIKESLQSVASVGLSSTSTPAVVDKACISGQCGASALAEALKAVQGQLQSLEKRVASLEIKCATCPPTGAPTCKAPAAKAAVVKAAPAPANKADDDDDVDLFGSDSEDDEEAAKVKEERLAAYAAKKSAKPALIAKSMIILDVKPWDDETNMKDLEARVREIGMDGLLWGASKLVPLAYGIHKLQITCVVEDDKVSVDLLTETIEGIEDLVQSVDIAAFNKI